MKSIWNLVAFTVLLFTVLIDIAIMGIDGLTIFNSFISGCNFMYYIADRIFVKQEQGE